MLVSSYKTWRYSCGKTVTNDEEIAAGFNEYFSTIGSMLSEAIRDCDTDLLSFSTVTHDNIFNLMK